MGAREGGKDCVKGVDGRAHFKLLLLRASTHARRDPFWKQSAPRTMERVAASTKGLPCTSSQTVSALLHACAAPQDPNLGISSISRLFEALGYRAAECYGFEDKVNKSRSRSTMRACCLAVVASGC